MTEIKKLEYEIKDICPSCNKSFTDYGEGVCSYCYENHPERIPVKKACDCDTCQILAKAVLMRPSQDKILATVLLNKAKKKSKPFHGYNPKKHSRKGGLSAKGRAHFKRKEGANLKPPVTTKPSKLKPGSKKAKRRKSFCARMSGVKGPTSKGGKLTPKGAALKRWNC